MTRGLLPLFAAVAAWSVGPAAAQDLGVKSPPQPGPVAIVNATIHPMSGPALERGYIAFDGGVITAIGSGDYVQAGPGTVVDATGRHVYPGLIGAVTQLGLTEIAQVPATIDTNEVGDFTPEVRAVVAVNPDSTLIPVTRANGVLLAGVFPTGGTVPGRAGVIRLDGWTWEDMTVRHDAGLVLNWPSMRPVRAWWMNQSDDDQRRRIREGLEGIDRRFDEAAAYIAARNAGAAAIDLRFEAMRPFLPAAADGAPPPRPVFIWAQDVDQITAAVAWASGRGLRAVIVGGRDAPLCSDLLRQHGVPVVVLSTFSFPKRADSPHDDAYTLPARLQAAGVDWCLANTDDTAHERSLPYIAAKAAAYGLDPDDALRGVTANTARILGVGDRYGTLEVGKSATLLVTDGSPLEVVTTIDRAFIDGRAIDLSSKHTALNAKYREKYRQLGPPPDDR